jgi:hypothetical protein
VVLSAGVVVLGVAALVLFDAVDPEPGLAGGVLILVGAALIGAVLVPPKDLRRGLGLVSSLSLGALGIDFHDYTGRAGLLPDEQDDKAAKTLSELRWRLEMKLTYLAKHVLARDPASDEPVPEFLTIGSLNHDGYLTHEQAKKASDILGMREYEFRALSEADKEEFLQGGSRFVATVRIEVFAAQVKAALAGPGWRLLPAYPERGRRDLLLQKEDPDDPTQHHVIPVFAQTAGSDLLAGPAKRLRDDSRAKGGGQSLLVVPPRSRAAGTEVDGVPVVTLPEAARRVSG